MSAEIPWPGAWPRRDLRVVVSLVILGMMTAGSVVGTVVAAVEGARAGFYVGLFFTALLLPTTVFGYLSKVRLRARRGRAARLGRDEHDEPALLVPYSRTLYLLYNGLGLLAMGLLVFLLLAAVGLFISGERSAPGTVGAVVLLLLVLAGLVWVGRYLVAWATGRLRRGFVLLSPAGIRHRGWAFDSYYPWEVVHEVHAGELDVPVIGLTVEHPGWLRRMSSIDLDGSTAGMDPEIISSKWITVDPALLYHTLRYYLDCPGARQELATGAAVQRVRRGDVPIVSST